MPKDPKRNAVGMRLCVKALLYEHPLTLNYSLTLCSFHFSLTVILCRFGQDLIQKSQQNVACSLSKLSPTGRKLPKAQLQHTGKYVHGVGKKHARFTVSYSQMWPASCPFSKSIDIQRFDLWCQSFKYAKNSWMEDVTAWLPIFGISGPWSWVSSLL